MTKPIEVLKRPLANIRTSRAGSRRPGSISALSIRDTGQKEKALEAFENCLKAGEGTRDPEKFPLKNAREFIASIKGEQ